MRKIALIIVSVLVIGGIASAASSHKSTGPTSSPALVTTTDTGSSATTPTTTTSKAPAAPQTFRGNGSENLGTINVPTDSTLTWSEPGGNQTGFAVSSDPTDNLDIINFDQHGTSGKDAVSAGTYKNVSVDADGSFTITVTAR